MLRHTARAPAGPLSARSPALTHGLRIPWCIGTFHIYRVSVRHADRGFPALVTRPDFRHLWLLATSASGIPAAYGNNALLERLMGLSMGSKRGLCGPAWTHLGLRAT